MFFTYRLCSFIEHLASRLRHLFEAWTIPGYTSLNFRFDVVDHRASWVFFFVAGKIKRKWSNAVFFSTCKSIEHFLLSYKICRMQLCTFSDQNNLLFSIQSLRPSLSKKQLKLFLSYCVFCTFCYSLCVDFSYLLIFSQKHGVRGENWDHAEYTLLTEANHETYICFDSFLVRAAFKR